MQEVPLYNECVGVSNKEPRSSGLRYAQVGGLQSGAAERRDEATENWYNLEDQTVL